MYFIKHVFWHAQLLKMQYMHFRVLDALTSIKYFLYYCVTETYENFDGWFLK